ncbi:MAG TPA: hypothetical protein VMW53_09010 [archaeon]|nr:hypothetical protein [archaeon]
MAKNWTFIIGILLLLVGYYVGAVGFNFGDDPGYELVYGPEGSKLYEVTYLHTYPWLGFLFGIYGSVIIAVGLLQKNETADEISSAIMEKINNLR